MIKRVVYPPWFQDFWQQMSALKTRSLGSKYDAFKEAQKIKMGPEDVDFLVQSFKKQTDSIRQVRQSGKWIEDHTDLCRWLKREGWENETSEQSVEPALPRSDQRKAEAAARYLARHMDGGMEQATGSQGDIRGTGQLDLGVLENKS